MKSKTIFVIALLAIAAMVLTACGTMAAQAAGSSAPQLQAGEAPSRTLSANGTGMVKLAPDIAYVTIGVRTQDKDAKTAVSLNSDQTQELIDSLIAFGVDEKDVQTTNFNIYSSEDYSQPYEGKPPVVYYVENSVSVVVRDLDGLGDLLSTAVESGANNIWGIQFDVSDKSAALSEARELAVKAARDQAVELAGFAEVELGQIVNISSYGGYPQPFGYGYGGGGGAVYEAAASVPVSPGMLSITVDVSIIFEIQ